MTRSSVRKNVFGLLEKRVFTPELPIARGLLRCRSAVTPAKAGVQNSYKSLDSGLRRNDNPRLLP